MGPCGSDQSRRVDDFGAKEHTFNELVAERLSLGATSLHAPSCLGRNRQAKSILSAEASGAWRVDAPLRFQPSKPPKPQTGPLGRRFTLPLPHPRRSGSLGCSPGWRPPVPNAIQKVVVKPILFQHFRFWAPPRPHIYPLHLLSKVFDRFSIDLRWNVNRTSRTTR